MKPDTAESPTPTEVLIPEARQHQRRRYQRSGAFIVLAAFVIAALVVSAVLLFRGPSAGSKEGSGPKPVAAAGASGLVYFRPVLCFAVPYAPPPGGTSAAAPQGPERIPACAPGSQLTASNLGVSTTTGQPANNPPPDPQYASYPTTNAHEPGYASSVVLLPGLKGACGVPKLRCVLGPAEMSSRSVGKATASQNRTIGWVVDYTTAGSAGAALLDKVAYGNFHQLLGIELDGSVYTAPLIQPAQSSFSSFDGRGEISGNLTRSQAVHLAKALSGHKG